MISVVNVTFDHIIHGGSQLTDHIITRKFTINGLDLQSGVNQEEYSTTSKIQT